MGELGGLLLFVGGCYPFRLAWHESRGRAIRHAVVWVTAAWLLECLAWGLGGGHAGRYLALCVAACAGVAVLGARRPGVGAWNFVVGGLLLALLRPFMIGLGELRLEPAHLAFLGAVLAVGVANFVPTGRWLAAVLFAGWCVVELCLLGGAIHFPELVEGCMPQPLIVIPWMALMLPPPARNEAGYRWQRFRDSYGYLWATRMREQFNRSAHNAGLPATLHWGGLDGEQERAVPLLRSILQRFEEEGEATAS